MGKSELINAIADQRNLSKADAGPGLAALTKTIEAALKTGDPITLIDFYAFEIKERAECKDRNSQTGQEKILSAQLTANEW